MLGTLLVGWYGFGAIATVMLSVGEDGFALFCAWQLLTMVVLGIGWRRPPISSSTCRCSITVLPKQSCRPMVRATNTPGRKTWLMWVARSHAGHLRRAATPIKTVVTRPVPGTSN